MTIHRGPIPKGFWAGGGGFGPALPLLSKRCHSLLSRSLAASRPEQEGQEKKTEHGTHSPHFELSRYAFHRSLDGSFRHRCNGRPAQKECLIVLMSLETDAQRRQSGARRVSRFHASTMRRWLFFLIMAVAAAEVAIGLAIIVKIFRDRQVINVDLIRGLK
jgi:NADH-quinone oxidoreductase subunit K